jgi:hypothetical protein
MKFTLAGYENKKPKRSRCWDCGEKRMLRYFVLKHRCIQQILAACHAIQGPEVDPDYRLFDFCLDKVL